MNVPGTQPPKTIDDYLKDYIKNDATYPLPQSGPRVTVGFWALENPIDGVKPDLNNEPFFTITYPVGRGAECYNWAHCTPDPEDPIHPNSANYITWEEGYLTIFQSTEFGCRPNLGNIKDPERKCMYWEVFRDMPDYLYGRIIATAEISDVVIREKAIIQLRAADGHYIRVTESNEVTCDKRLYDSTCNFTARFPNYIWNEHGGTGDEREFYLQADNGKFLRTRESDNETIFVAEAETMEDALAFNGMIKPGPVINLQTNDGLFLQHEPPYGKLLLTDGIGSDADWAWFYINYL